MQQGSEDKGDFHFIALDQNQGLSFLGLLLSQLKLWVTAFQYTLSPYLSNF